MTIRVLIVGTGRICREYIKCLNNLSIPADILGRKKSTALNLQKETKKRVFWSIDDLISENIYYSHAIIAVPIEESVNSTLLVIEKVGIKSILAEKPGAIDSEGLGKIIKYAELKNVDVFVAYNRRFFDSVLMAKDIVQDEGLKNLKVIFNEAIDKIPFTKFTQSVLDNWVQANASHVIDIGLLLGGIPIELNGETYGENVFWRDRPAKFNYIGIGPQEAKLEFTADWHCPGSWEIFFKTNNGSYVLSPLEVLQKLNHPYAPVTIIKTEADNFKPGFMKQVSFFVNGQWEQLLSVQKQQANMRIYEHINSPK